METFRREAAVGTCAGRPRLRLMVELIGIERVSSEISSQAGKIKPPREVPRGFHGRRSEGSHPPYPGRVQIDLHPGPGRRAGSGRRRSSLTLADRTSTASPKDQVDQAPPQLRRSRRPVASHSARLEQLALPLLHAAPPCRSLGRTSGGQRCAPLMRTAPAQRGHDDHPAVARAHARPPAHPQR